MHRGNTTDTVKLTVVYIGLINSCFFTEPEIDLEVGGKKGSKYTAER